VTDDSWDDPPTLHECKQLYASGVSTAYDTALKWNRLANQDRPADERESMTQTIDRIIDMLHQCGDHFAVTRYRGARSLAQHELELGGSEGLGL
jgi:hypothetical protein